MVIVGEDPASQVYVGSKGRMAEACGFKSVKHALPADTSEADLLALVAALNADASIHGILLQLPLPKPLDPLPIIRTIAPEKDVDGLNEVNAGRVALGDFGRAFVPCTPAGSMVLIRSIVPQLSGKTAVVLGRSNLVGKPIASLLLAADCTVTVAHSRTADLPALCRTADILVAAVGRPEMVEARLDQARGRGDRRRDQPRGGPRQGRRQDAARRRRRFRGRGRARLGRDTRPGRRRPHDDRHADGEHACGGEESRRPALIDRRAGAP